MRFLLLIVILGTGDQAPAVTQIDYNTERSCERAIEAFEERFAEAGLSSDRVIMSCSDRGSEY